MSKKIFEKVQVKNPPRSVFDLSHDVKMSLKYGKLYPSMVMECVPGDKVTLSCEALVRFAPLVAPVMHRINVFMHYFFVPTRLLWPGWEDFITQQPYDGVPPTHPYMVYDNTITTEQVSDISYFGLPKASGPITGVNINPFPFAAYQMIYNEYYRDQNLIPEVDFELADGDNTSKKADLWKIRYRAWEHDYFTSALPFAQKGNPVEIPMIADVVLKPDWLTDEQIPRFEEGSGSAPTGDVTQATAGLFTGVTLDGTDFAAYNPQGSLAVDGALTTINDLRRAYRLQEWYEKQARGGTRYIESILAHFGVRSSDARLQRPEYITGTKAPVTVSEVLNTTGSFAEETPTSPPQGNMAGHGVSVTSGNYGSHYCEEHGYIIGIVSILPMTAYQNGISKMFLKTEDPFEYYWPEFAQIGEQEIKHVELYSDAATPDAVFGYIPRYAEYKYINNRVAGDFFDTLAFWHIGRIFETQPELNQDFIECRPRIDAFAVNADSQDYLYCHVYHKIRAVRPMPFFGTPTF